MKCPICRKEIKLNSPEMPFCSRRCREADLGNWAMEKYRVPGQRAARAESEPEVDGMEQGDTE